MRSRSISAVRSTASPASTSTCSERPSSASRAALAASPVPSGVCWTATSAPSKWAAVVGEATTTIGSAPASRAAPITQSTMRRPRSGCRCLATDDFIRVPRPAARKTAAIGESLNVREGLMAGAPGFEPGIAGPKPAALPLGYAPLPPSIGARRRAPDRARSDAVALEKEEDERDYRQNHDRGDRRPLRDEEDDRDEHGQRLRGREDPGDLTRERRGVTARDRHPEHDREHEQRVQGQVR